MPKFLLGRRQFAVGAAAAATAALICPGEVLAQATGNIAEIDEKTRTAMAKLSAGARGEVEAKVANIFRKYGSRLSEEQRADIRRIMAETQDGLEKMRAFPLENGDQPADAFRAYRREAESAPAKSSSAKSSSAKPVPEKKEEKK